MRKLLFVFTLTAVAAQADMKSPCHSSVHSSRGNASKAESPREFATKNDAIAYYSTRLMELSSDTVAKRGGGRNSTTIIDETRWYAGGVAPENYLGSTYEWTQYSRNTCGTVIAWPRSEFVIYENFTFKDVARSLKKTFKGKAVTVAIGISSTADISESARTRAQKNLVESGGNYKNENGKPIRLPPLNRMIRKRFGFASMKTVYLKHGAMFLLFDCDESKDDVNVRIMQSSQNIGKKGV